MNQTLHPIRINLDKFSGPAARQGGLHRPLTQDQPTFLVLAQIDADILQAIFLGIPDGIKKALDSGGEPHLRGILLRLQFSLVAWGVIQDCTNRCNREEAPNAVLRTRHFRSVTGNDTECILVDDITKQALCCSGGRFCIR